MSELISKEQAMAYPLSYEHYDKVHGSIKFINGVESYRDYIDGLPTVEERKHGHWIKVRILEGTKVKLNNTFKCSVCEKKKYLIKKPMYCENCGAIMDESEEKENENK